MFLLEAAMLGYFVALNFFFFFIFWEFSLVPAFFMIQNWGRDPKPAPLCGLQVLRLHHGRLDRDAAAVPVLLCGDARGGRRRRSTW